MNAKRVAAAAQVICESQKRKTTAAGIAADLEAACLLQSPETAAEVKQIQGELAEYEMLSPQQCPKGLHLDWLVDSESSHACPWCEIDRLLTERHSTNEALSEAAVALRAQQDRITELEAGRDNFLLPWAHKLDAKTLDNFAGDLIRAAESPLMLVVNEIHDTVRNWRELMAARNTEIAPVPHGDPIAYGPTGIQCGCGKDAHSNLVPCRALPTEGKLAEQRHLVDPLDHALEALAPLSTPLPGRGETCECGHSGADHHHAGTACWAHLPRTRMADRAFDAIRLCDCRKFALPVTTIETSGSAL